MIKYIDTNCIETDRLKLRLFDIEKDIDAYADIMGEYEVGKWLPKGEGYTKEETKRSMNFVLENWKEHGYGYWAVTDKETDILLGHCGLNYVKAFDEVEVLYAFGKHGRGKGYATEAAKASLLYAFDKIGLDHIIALAKPENQASQNVMKKLGMKYIKSTEVFNLNVVYYSITKKEFELGLNK